MRGLKRMALKMKNNIKKFKAKIKNHLFSSSIFHLPSRRLKTGEDYHSIKKIVKRFLLIKKLYLIDMLNYIYV
jgi:hypothetical protein